MVLTVEVRRRAARSCGYCIGANGKTAGVDCKSVARPEFLQVFAVPACGDHALDVGVEIVRRDLPVEIRAITCSPWAVYGLHNTAAQVPTVGTTNHKGVRSVSFRVVLHDLERAGAGSIDRQGDAPIAIATVGVLIDGVSGVYAGR